MRRLIFDPRRFAVFVLIISTTLIAIPAIGLASVADQDAAYLVRQTNQISLTIVSTDGTFANISEIEKANVRNEKTTADFASVAVNEKARNFEIIIGKRAEIARVNPVMPGIVGNAAEYSYMEANREIARISSDTLKGNPRPPENVIKIPIPAGQIVPSASNSSFA